MPCLGQMLNTMTLCAPPYMPGYPGSILYGRAMCIFMCLAYILFGHHAYIPAVFWQAWFMPLLLFLLLLPLLLCMQFQKLLPFHVYLFILEYFRLAWHFYKCMPITMPDAPDIYANFMLFLLLLLLLLFIDLQGCCYSFLCMPIVISAAICHMHKFHVIAVITVTCC